jgi:hypothetical protein
MRDVNLGPDNVYAKIPNQNHEASLYTHTGTGFEGLAARLPLMFLAQEEGYLRTSLNGSRS